MIDILAQLSTQEVDDHLVYRLYVLASVVSYNADMIDDAIKFMREALNRCTEAEAMPVFNQNMGAFYNRIGGCIALRSCLYVHVLVLITFFIYKLSLF
jgi:hypothetical protein